MLKWFLSGLLVLLGTLSYFLWPEPERSRVEAGIDKGSLRNLATCLVPQIRVDSASFSMNLSLIQSHLDEQRRVVALGESTHGSSELISWRVYFTKYLIENLGYNSIGIETTYSEAQAINSFVNGDSVVDAKTALKRLRYPLLFNQQMLTLINWLRDHNREANEKVKFFGFPMGESTSSRDKYSNSLHTGKLHGRNAKPFAYR